MNINGLVLALCAGSALSLSAAAVVVPPTLPYSPFPDAIDVVGDGEAHAGLVAFGANGKPLHRAAAQMGQRGFPNFDIRLTEGEKGVATPEVAAAIHAARTPAHQLARDNAIARLNGEVPGVRIGFDQFTGTAASVLSTEQFLTGQSPPLHVPTAIQAAGDFVARYTDLFDIAAAELDAARLTRNAFTEHNGVQSLTFQQQFHHIDIHGAVLTANVMRDGRLVNIGSTFVPRPANDFVMPETRLTAQDALRAAAANVGIPLSSTGTATSAAPSDDAEAVAANRSTIWRGIPELGTSDRVVTTPVYFPRTRTDVRPAWSVVVPTHGVGNTYDIIVDANDGTILERTNRLVWDTTQPATYRVFTNDSPAPMSPGTPTPSALQAPFVQQQLVTVTPDEIRPFSPNGWIPDNTFQTVGNNVDAHSDIDANNLPDNPRPTNTGRIFDYPYNPTQAPSTYTNAAVVQMFYWSNRYHDRLYAMGFTEAFRNFQTDNFGRGGLGGDQMQVDVQDGSGTNNANFNGNGVDGSSGRVQMYIFTGSTPNRDGALDGDVVFHELTHGTSIRLHEGLTANVSRGMGEGWSDFFGISLLAEPTDDLNGIYTTGGYVTYQFLNATYTSNYYFGIRRFPYSTDFAKNPQTYADTSAAQQAYPTDVPRSPIIGNDAEQVHNTGEVWCNTLLEGRAAISASRGFVGNQAMMQHVVDGMKLHGAAQPSFLDSRNTILQGDMASGNVDRTNLWRAFAKRGMGFQAVTQGGGTSTTGLVENFQSPEQAIYSYPQGTPTQLQPGQPTSYNINIAEFNLTLVPDSGLLHYSINGAAFTTAPMTQTAAGRYTATLPALTCFDQIRYYSSVGTSAGRLSDPLGAPIGAFLAQAFTGIDSPLTDTGETDEGWTTSFVPLQPGGVDGAWERGVPHIWADPRGAPQADFDHVGTGKCWLTSNNAVTSNSDVDNGSAYLTSRVFAIANGDTLSYAAWYNDYQNTANTGDGLYLQYQTAAAAPWVALRSYPTPSPTWRTARLIVGTDMPASPTMRIRFIASDASTGSIVECGVDAIKIERLVCVPPTSCIADFNNDGGIDGQDIEAFFQSWEIAEPSADVNQDGGVDGQDIEYFFIRWEAGIC